jgi:superfamily II DNA or RNA helicase
MIDDPRATGARVQLRPYQDDAIESVRERFREDRRALLVMCTGAGKTLTALTIAAKVVAKGGRVLWLAHRRELVEQPVRAWNALAQLRGVGTAGIVQAERDDFGADLVCASMGTVGRAPTTTGSRLRRIMEADAPPIRLIVQDEAHHVAADGRGMFAALMSSIDEVAGDVRPFVLGLTATPERADGRDLSGLWGDAPAYVYAYTRAISEGYLVPPRIILDRLELDDETRATVAASRDSDGGVDRETAKALQDAGLVDHTVGSICRHLGGRSVIAFVCDLAQAYDLRGELLAAGVRAEVVAGETKGADRAQRLADFKAGRVDVLVNCSVLTEGTDLPRCDAIVLARPFASKVLFVQAVGRGLRLYPGKADCLLLDVLGATEEHSLTHAAAMLKGKDPKRDPFVGTMRRRVSVTIKARPPEPARRILVRLGAEVQCAPREHTPEGDSREWLIVSVEGEGAVDPPVPVRRPQDVASDSDGVALPDLMRERERVEAHWTTVPGAGGRAWVAGIGTAGRVWLVQVGTADEWMSYHVPKRSRTPRALDVAPMDPGFARGLGDDLFRQAAKLVGAGARWRDRPPSGKQRQYAERLGLRVAGDTAGDYADAITQHAAGKWWAAHGSKFAEVTG